MDNQSDMDSSEFLHSLWYLSRSLMRFVHKAALENDLSIPQYSLVLAIAPHKEMTQKQIGEKLQIPKSTLSQAVDGLVQAGWLYREPVQDNRREIQLILSEKGVALFEKMSAQKEVFIRPSNPLWIHLLKHNVSRYKLPFSISQIL